MLEWTPTGTGMLALGVRPHGIWKQGWETQSGSLLSCVLFPPPLSCPSSEGGVEGGNISVSSEAQ